MRGLFFTLTIVIIFTSCKSYVQLIETSSTNASFKDDFYVYENDTVEIKYSFWQEDGIVSFSVYNKLNRPIYIDWKKSSYIDNSNKFNYWNDDEVRTSVASYGRYYYGGPLIKPGIATQPVTKSSTSISKLERVTFIPPKSKYYRSQFFILPAEHFRLDASADYMMANSNYKKRKQTKIYIVDYSKESSPLVFRNFLAFSLTEDFKEEFYVDNEFYISSVLEMESNHFMQYDGDWHFPMRKENSFYVDMPKEDAVEKRN